MDESDGGEAQVSTKRALLIGINNYPNFPDANQLYGCVNEIVEIRAFLIEHAGFIATNVDTLLSPHAVERAKLRAELANAPEATAQNIRQYFDALVSKSHEGDEVFVYYAGHGVRVMK